MDGKKNEPKGKREREKERKKAKKTKLKRKYLSETIDWCTLLAFEDGTCDAICAKASSHN